VELDLPFQLGSVALLAVGLYLVVRRQAPFLTAFGSATFVVVLATSLVAEDVFHAMRLLAWFGFVHLPVCLLAYAVFRRREPPRSFAALGVAVAAVLIGADAFLLEPSRLQVSHHTLSIPGLSTPVRMLVLADIQTDEFGEYERRVFDEVAALKPDLVLFAGDYVQVYDGRREAQVGRFRDLLLTLNPRLGAWAVRGNVDPPEARDIFRGTKVTYLEQTETVRVSDEITLVGLSMEDSFDPHVVLPPSKTVLRIVLGHAPDFSLGTVDGVSKDLFFAGHTHGGQVQLPFIGPLITFSEVPRRWAGGDLIHLSDQRALVVSRGIGMERGHAPRLRFLCPPEIVVFDVSPGPVSRAAASLAASSN
jgi:uncharacterized protein